MHVYEMAFGGSYSRLKWMMAIDDGACDGRSFCYRAGCLESKQIWVYITALACLILRGYG